MIGMGADCIEQVFDGQGGDDRDRRDPAEQIRNKCDTILVLRYSIMFSFPVETRGRYVMANPPVVRVVVQIGFPPVARLATNEGIAELQEALGEGYRLQPAQAAGFQISVGPPGMMSQNYAFARADGYEVTVSTESVSVAIDHRYQDRAAFSEVLEPVLAALLKVGRMKEYARMGVRYINAAPATADEFRTWFRPEFVGWAANGVLAAGASPTWVLITQLNQDTVSIITNGVIRYGYLHQGVGQDVTTSPAGASPSFIADIDLGSMRPGPFEPTALTEAFRTINHEIAAFLEYTMTDEGRQHFALTAKPE
jgi:uncharacterized protein (TIGR04255 family)